VTTEPGSLLDVSFRLNGVARTCLTPASRRLSSLLRDEFGLSAARTACGIGRCGACMVLLNGRLVNSCLMMAWQIGGTEIITAEGLDALPEARLARTALIEENAFQCGYCAPGFVTALTAALRKRELLDEAGIRRALAGNICRCTGYHSILRGAARAFELLAADDRRGGDPS